MHRHTRFMGCGDEKLWLLFFILCFGRHDRTVLWRPEVMLGISLDHFSMLFPEAEVLKLV